jgi:predicted DNA-binding transcriptional regulator AlpA
MISLDDIAKGADLSTLSRDQVASLLHRLAAAQTRLATAIVEASSQAEDHLLNVEEAAQRLGETPEWLYRRSKSLPFIVRLGGHVRYSARGIEQYIAARKGR